MNANAIMHNPHIQQLLTLSFGTDIIYSFIIILSSLMIYFGTKELYELTLHKGIKYFRMAFLFFAIAYFFRSFIKFTLVYFGAEEIMEISPKLFGILSGQVTLFAFMYFSSISIFYLLYSVMYKKWEKNSNIIYLFHGLALLISFVMMIFNNSIIYLLVNLFLLIFIIAAFYVSREQSRKKKTRHNLHIIYTLLFLFWGLNIIDILIPSLFQAFQLLVYLASITIFLLMLYRVLRVGSN